MSVQEAVRTAAPLYEKIGIKPRHESERARKTRSILGERASEVVDYEADRNRRFFEREFLDDEPVSFAVPYVYGRDGRLLAFPIDHPHWLMARGIDPAERDGGTRAGFCRFEVVTAKSADKLSEAGLRPIDHVLRDTVYPGTVSLWYSHAGPAGQKPPFDKRFYESGRLYVRFPLSREWSLQVDVKVSEDGRDGNARFPIAKLLEHFYLQSPQRAEPVLLNAGPSYYLTHPFDTGLNIRQFLDTLKAMPQESGIDSEDLVYVQRRYYEDRQYHTLADIVPQIERQLLLAQSELDYLLRQQEEFRDYMQRGAISEAVNYEPFASAQRFQYEAVARRYMDIISRRMDQNGGSLRLYGCSATVELTRADIFGHTLETLMSGIVPDILNARSPMDTSLRLFPYSAESATHFSDYQCDNCGGTLSGEPKNGSWRTACGNCGEKFNCKAA